MIINYIKLAFRNLIRDNVYSFINIGGLAIGIAACLMLLLWAQDELSFDRFHQNAGRIYRTNASFNSNGNIMTWHYTPGPVAKFGEQEIPSIEDGARISNDNGTMIFKYDNKTFAVSGEEDRTAYVDPAYFAMFSFPFIQGSTSNPFPDNNSVVMTESMARNIFGRSDALGMTAIVNNDKSFTVSGIIKDIPSNSSLQYSVLFPFDILIKDHWGYAKGKGVENDWGNYNYQTFFMLFSSASHDSVARELTAVHHRNQKESQVTYLLQPLTKLHLYNADLSEGGIQTVRIFLIVAVAILLIASINYINLATARGSQRAREVGVRKTVGADRAKLVMQFLSESAILCILALLVSLVIIQLAIPFYNSLSGKNIILTFNATIISFIISTLVLTWLVAGVYPALVLSSFQPVQVIRGKLTLSGANSTFRKILVVTQFTLSIVIIIGTLIVGDQLEFIRNRKLGFNKDNIFVFGLHGDMSKNKETIRTELMKQTGVEAVTFANQSILDIGNTTGDTDWEGKSKEDIFMIHGMSIDENFIETLGLEFVAGIGFTGSKTDSASFILNETAVAEIGMTDPVGKSFSMWDIQGTIIGVVKDFHHHSIHKKIEPTAFFHQPSWMGIAYVKTDGQHSKEAIEAAQKLWKQYNPDYPFHYKFIDIQFDRMYKTEQRMAELFTAFSTIAIIISCLGLFGLATFTASQRVKEIGIRKVLGATVNQIVMLLSRDFLRLVVVAIMIAAPVSYYIVGQWLSDFAYHTPVRWSVFVFAGVLSLLIAFFTMSFQTIKAALGNPVNSLRSE